MIEIESEIAFPQEEDARIDKVPNGQKSTFFTGMGQFGLEELLVGFGPCLEKAFSLLEIWRAASGRTKKEGGDKVSRSTVGLLFRRCHEIIDSVHRARQELWRRRVALCVRWRRWRESTAPPRSGWRSI